MYEIMMHGFGGFGGIGGMGTYGWIGLILNFVIMAAIIVGVVLLIVWLVRRLNRGPMMMNNQVTPTQSAKDIASARYARGEITRDEYQQIISDLSH